MSVYLEHEFARAAHQRHTSTAVCAACDSRLQGYDVSKQASFDIVPENGRLAAGGSEPSKHKGISHLTDTMQQE